jgi:hypothetical protein
LLIRESKLRKSRLLPLNGGIAREINRYLHARARRKLPLSNTALIWNAIKGGEAYSARHLHDCLQHLFQQWSIFTSKGVSSVSLATELTNCPRTALTQNPARHF